MSKPNNKAVPFYSSMMGFGMILFFASFFFAPNGRFDVLDYSVSYAGAGFMTAIALFVFGMVFGFVAAISARVAHIKRMKAEGAQVDADAADASDSRPNTNTTSSLDADATAAAIFTSPAPQAMVVESAARPRVEPSLSTKD